MTASANVRASEARKIKAGGRRMPSGIMSPEAVKAMNSLMRKGYSSSMTACIERALIDAINQQKGLCTPPN